MVSYCIGQGCCPRVEFRDDIIIIRDDNGGSTVLTQDEAKKLLLVLTERLGKNQVKYRVKIAEGKVIISVEGCVEVAISADAGQELAEKMLSAINQSKFPDLPNKYLED